MRFFSALLIPKASHPQFFLDLKCFREQPSIVYLLKPGTSENYHEVSRSFIGSRFAHPWCRLQSDFGKGWRRASWVGATDKNREEIQKVKKEEDRLHRLLVPIWIAMRRRMFPGDEVVKEWVERENEREAERATGKAEEASTPKAPSNDSRAEATGTALYPELGFAIKSAKPSPVASTPADPEAAAAASKMFLGVALTGFVMSDKRVKKYVEKKLLKKK